MPALHAPLATGIPDAPLPSSISVLVDTDVGCVGVFHTDNVIAGIDVINLARHAAREIAEEIHRGVTDFFDRDAAPEWRVVLVPFEDVAEVADPRRRQRLYRTGGDGVDPDVLLAHIAGPLPP